MAIALPLWIALPLRVIWCFPANRRFATLAAIVTMPFRTLCLLLLCLLVAGPMSTPAWALARPETRVGKIFSAPLKSASTDLDQTVATRRESRGCGYDFASGVCKYLYCHANPVNGWDPSGNEFQLGGLLSAMGNGLRMAAQTGFNGYSAYSRAKWLKEGTELISRSIATGTFDPMAVGLMLADVIPFGKVAGKVGQVPGIKQLLGNFNKLSNAAKGQAGEMVANAVARAKGYLPSGFRPRGNGGFDGLFREGNLFVVVEGKLGANPLLNAASGSNPAQMSQDWIRKNVQRAIKELDEYNPQLARELETAYSAGRIKGMVVKTQIDAAGNVIDDPSFIVKELSEIGRETF